MGTGGDVQTLLEAEPLRSKDRGLFTYNIDICNVSNLLKFVLFADDTNIFCSNENVEVLQDTLNRELANFLYGSRLINYL